MLVTPFVLFQRDDRGFLYRLLYLLLTYFGIFNLHFNVIVFYFFSLLFKRQKKYCVHLLG